jgi:hypothetical protein
MRERNFYSAQTLCHKHGRITLKINTEKKAEYSTTDDNNNDNSKSSDDDVDDNQLYVYPYVYI